MAGYSATPLTKKLGIKPGHYVALIHAAADFESKLEGLPADTVLVRNLSDQPAFDVIVLFAAASQQLHRMFSSCRKKLEPNGGLWVAWPKKASRIATDLTEDVIRNFGLETGLVDNKVCAIDEAWSGLRFVVRLQDRPKKR